MTSTVSGISIRHPDVGLIIGSYRILALLGEGGMGLVYLAEHVRLGRKVALKRLKERYAGRPDAVQRFFEEARAVNRIKHPNIVEITDFVKEEGLAYYVMEFLVGRSLAQVIQAEGVLEVRRSLHIAHQVAEALNAAHEEGIVHLDIKPSNIFLTQREGRSDFVKLLDFGVAQFADPGPQDASASSWAGQSLGTPVYMSPEQIRGDPVDHRSDLYSLGVVLYEMLAGQPPFKATSTAEYAYKHMSVRPKTLSQMSGLPHKIPRACSRTVNRCLEKDPADRFQSADELKDHLKKAALSTGIVFKDGAGALHVDSSWSPRRLAVLTGTAVAVLLVTGGAGMLLLGRSAGQQRAAPEKTEVSSPVAARSRPAAESVTLNIQTTPPGAEIRCLAPAKRVLGLTPLELELPRSSTRWKLVAQRQGYVDKVVEVVPDRDRALVLELGVVNPSPAARPGSRPGASKSAQRVKPTRRARRLRRRTTRRLDENRTMNPFK